MAIYQCFFFSEGRIRDWENVECETNSSLRTLIARRLVNGAWDAAEGWLQDKLFTVSSEGSLGPIAVCSSPPRDDAAGARRCVPGPAAPRAILRLEAL
jgi:hypothetical protein